MPGAQAVELGEAVKDMNRLSPVELAAQA